jgi:hypothetical protein
VTELKKILGLVVAVAMVAGVMAGCGPSEPTYTGVTVGSMTVSIPDDWQRPEDYEDMLGSIINESTAGWVEADVYEAKSGDFLILIESIDMVAYYELQNWGWRGWDAELEEAGMTKEDYVEYYIQSGLADGSAEITLVARQSLTIGGYESWESSFTADDGEDITHISVVVVFAPDDLGVLQLMLKEDDWAKFEDTWTTIRDSITI